MDDFMKTVYATMNKELGPKPPSRRQRVVSTMIQEAERGLIRNMMRPRRLPNVPSDDEDDGPQPEM